jgi:hypothetical protein
VNLEEVEFLMSMLREVVVAVKRLILTALIATSLFCWADYRRKSTSCYFSSLVKNPV